MPNDLPEEFFENRVGIVVLTYNRREEVLSTLVALTQMTGRAAIVVADNGSRDGTSDAVAENFPDVEIARLSQNLGAAGRNAGVARLTTPYVAFSDDDTIWEPGSLSAAADILDRHADIAVISAHVLIGAERRDDPACRPMANSPLDSDGVPGKALLGFMAGACVMRVAAFREVGGYMPELFIGGEEAPMALDLLSLGWKIVYCPQVVTRHLPSPQRDVPQRRWLLLRNAVWTACLRLPWRLAMKEIVVLLPAMFSQRAVLKICGETLRKSGWLIRQRHVVPANVQAMWQQIHVAPERRRFAWFNIGTGAAVAQEKFGSGE
ncbi:MAG: glycosyl transferase family 2 [Rhodocyclales bacterium]|nr:glycosyl transferase family 2 [Rhodocyclales bacterium]